MTDRQAFADTLAAYRRTYDEGADNPRDRTEAHRNIQALYDAKQAECSRLRAALSAVLDDLEDAYDGASDSPTKWMSHHITQGRLLAPAKGTVKS